jgi:hypothetical protein
MNRFAYRRSYDLPGGFSVDFVLEGARLEAQWSPKPPKGKRAKKLLPAYRLARDDFMRSLRVNALVIEL